MTEHKLAPGTLRRVVGFARPYRKELAIFLVLTIDLVGDRRRYPAAGR